MHETACPVCTALAIREYALLVHLVIALQTLMRTSCPGCLEPWGEHALAHPHARTGQVSSCPGMAEEESMP
jgi:hypothetical protein